MGEDTSSAYIKFSKWDGKKTSFLKFKKDFLGTIAATTKYREYEKQMEDGTKILGTHKPSVKTDAVEAKAEEDLRTKDVSLMRHLETCVSGCKAAEDMLNVAASDVDELVHLHGCFKTTWKNLASLCSVTNDKTMRDLKKDYMNVTMSNGEDPKGMIGTLTSLRKKLKDEYQHHIDSDEFLMQVVDNLPSEYRAIIDRLKKSVEDGAATLLAIQTEIDKEFGYLYPDFDTSKGKDTALTATDGTDKFVCFHCNEPGHKKYQCPKLKTGGGGRGSGGRGNGGRGKRANGGRGGRGGGNNSDKECHHCHKKGHIRKDCHKLKAEQASRRDSASVATGASEGYTRVDVVLVASDGLFCAPVADCSVPYKMTPTTGSSKHGFYDESYSQARRYWGQPYAAPQSTAAVDASASPRKLSPGDAALKGRQETAVAAYKAWAQAKQVYRQKWNEDTRTPDLVNRVEDILYYPMEEELSHKAKHYPVLCAVDSRKFDPEDQWVVAEEQTSYEQEGKWWSEDPFVCALPKRPAMRLLAYQSDEERLAGRHRARFEAIHLSLSRGTPPSDEDMGLPPTPPCKETASKNRRGDTRKFRLQLSLHGETDIQLPVYHTEDLEEAGYIMGLYTLLDDAERNHKELHKHIMHYIEEWDELPTPEIIKEMKEWLGFGAVEDPKCAAADLQRQHEAFGFFPDDVDSDEVDYDDDDSLDSDPSDGPLLRVPFPTLARLESLDLADAYYNERLHVDINWMDMPPPLVDRLPQAEDDSSSSDDSEETATTDAETADGSVHPDDDSWNDSNWPSDDPSDGSSSDDAESQGKDGPSPDSGGGNPQGGGNPSQDFNGRDPDDPMNQVDSPALVAISEQDLSLIVLSANGYAHGPNTFLADTGASTHMGHSKAGMFDLEDSPSGVKIGDGKALAASALGKRKSMVVQADGTKVGVTLANYKCVEGLWTNLFSITSAVAAGWKLTNEGRVLVISKDNVTIRFDRIFEMGTGYLAGAEILPVEDVASVILEPGKTVDINKCHRILGHTSEETLRLTAKSRGLKLSGKFHPCEDCQISKARQRNVPKLTEGQSEVPGERLLLDISSVKNKSYGSSKFWLLVEDDCTTKTYSFFLKTKDQLAGKVLQLLISLAKRGIKLKFIRMDNAGENKTLMELVGKSTALPHITFELTPPHSPQFQGKIERKFATLWARCRALLNAGGFGLQLRNGLWTEAARMADMIENQLVTPRFQAVGCPNKQFYGTDWEGFVSLRQFGEMAVVKTAKEHQSKLKDKGTTMIYLGPAADHAKDVYRFLNPGTRKVVESRDVLWLDKVHGVWKGIKNPPNKDDQVTQVTTDIDIAVDTDDEGPSEDEWVVDLEEDDEPPPLVARSPRAATPTRVQFADRVDTSAVAPTPKVARAMKKLTGAGNPLADSLVERHALLRQTRGTTGLPTGGEAEEEIDVANILASLTMIDKTGGDFGDVALAAAEAPKVLTERDMERLKPEAYKDNFECPRTYHEAWNHPSSFQRSKWRAAIQRELDKMEEHKVWKIVKKSSIPRGKRPIKNRWIHEVKRSGVFRSRLVACGYSQIGGQDFDQVYNSVVNDVTFRMMLVAKMYLRLDSLIFDVSVAFLNADMDFDNYMRVPEGVVANDDECVLLLKALYGTVQASRQWGLKFASIMRKFGFTQSAADPCLFYRRNERGLVIMCIYIDDGFAIGDKPALEEMVEQMRDEGLEVKVEFSMEDYLSCHVLFDKSGEKAWLGQPHMVKKIVSTFGDEVKGMRSFLTPGMPGTSVVRPKVESEQVSPEMQTRYRSGVGMLLYLVKHSRPEIANAVRELTRCMDKATKEAYREMLRVLKYVCDTQTLGLKMFIKRDEGDPMDWQLVIYSDSDWANCKETRKSISGFVMFLCGVPIMWRSKQQKSVSLSSTEAEWYALSEAVKEILFVAMVLLDMGISVKTPIVVRVDNMGAVFMTENASSSSRTRHVDTRWHFVRELSEDKFISVIFVPTAENWADGFTKNIASETLRSHEGKYVVDRAELE